VYHSRFRIEQGRFTPVYGIIGDLHQGDWVFIMIIVGFLYRRDKKLRE
jgi:hypothetical protein